VIPAIRKGFGAVDSVAHIDKAHGRTRRRHSTRTTEVVYRRELRPVITSGAEIMD
jgi:hypothetical protein